MDIINKTYKRKNDIHSSEFVVEKMEGDFIIFTNGARCSTNTLINDFQEVSHMNDQTYKHTNIMTESANINPDTFFDTPLADENVLSKLDTIATNPNAIIQSTNQLHNYSEPVVNESRQVDLSNRLNDDNPNGNFQQHLDITNNVQQPAEYATFERVKKDEEIDINISLKIKLPKAKKIDALNDLFESSFIEYLSKQYIKKYLLDDSTKIQKNIEDAIESWMDSELYDNKPKRNTKTKQTKAKITTVEARHKVVSDKIITNTENETKVEVVDSMFRPTFDDPNWDGDIKKLFIINTEQQYLAVKKQYDFLIEKNLNPQESDRLSELIELYQEQTK